MCRLMTPQLEEALKGFPLGIAIGLMEDEYSYISLNELSEIELDLTAQGLGKLQVRQQPNFQPTELRLLNDKRLQRFLARFE